MPKKQYDFYSEVEETIMCPAHNKKIKLVVLENGTKVAVCTCDDRPNKHLNQVVYQETPATKE